MELSGTVTSGLGRAHVFMAQSHYQEQFKTVLGSGAWPGTLNVDILEDEINTYQKLRVIAGLEQGENSSETESIRIAGFEREGRSFGGATAFPASISSDGEHWINCAILIPDLTRHTETAEVISSSFLRERLPCSDGDLVTLRLG
ncbi:MAG: DUF120 domain-containing protein [Euryarchaeota archaeon]|nr:hypothetical protein [Euryarchaeota archaeon]|tara:strand:+ start:455 stop:889 length:435 start_codon:yes stop_codon:yes gene_type:complete